MFLSLGLELWQTFSFLHCTNQILESEDRNYSHESKPKTDQIGDVLTEILELQTMRFGRWLDDQANVAPLANTLVREITNQSILQPTDLPSAWIISSPTNCYNSFYIATLSQRVSSKLKIHFK